MPNQFVHIRFKFMKTINRIELWFVYYFNKGYVSDSLGQTHSPMTTALLYTDMYSLRQIASKTTIAIRFINNILCTSAALHFSGQWVWVYSKFTSNTPMIFKNEVLLISESVVSNYHFINYNPPSPIISDSEHTLYLFLPHEINIIQQIVTFQQNQHFLAQKYFMN